MVLKKTNWYQGFRGRIMKQRIVTETIHQIQTKGFTFTISDLAKQLAVSKRTIYEHFSSKDEIVYILTIPSLIKNIAFLVSPCLNKYSPPL